MDRHNEDGRELWGLLLAVAACLLLSLVTGCMRPQPLSPPIGPLPTPTPTNPAAPTSTPTPVTTPGCGSGQPIAVYVLQSSATPSVVQTPLPATVTPYPPLLPPSTNSSGPVTSNLGTNFALIRTSQEWSDFWSVRAQPIPPEPVDFGSEMVVLGRGGTSISNGSYWELDHFCFTAAHTEIYATRTQVTVLPAPVCPCPSQEHYAAYAIPASTHWEWFIETTNYVLSP